MTKINFDEVMRMLEFKRKINNIPLEEVEWVRDDGSTINFNKELLKFWKFCGLSNAFFVEDILSRVISGEEEELLKEFSCLLINVNN